MPQLTVLVQLQASGALRTSLRAKDVALKRKEAELAQMKSKLANKDRELLQLTRKVSTRARASSPPPIQTRLAGQLSALADNGTTELGATLLVEQVACCAYISAVVSSLLLV